MVEEPPDELQREVLEGQGRPVEELEQPFAGIELHERADSRMAEARVGLGAQPLQHGGLQLSARERPDHPGGGAGVRLARANARQIGPALGNVQPAVAREPGEHVSQKPSAGARPRVEM